MYGCCYDAAGPASRDRLYLTMLEANGRANLDGNAGGNVRSEPHNHQIAATSPDTPRQATRNHFVKCSKAHDELRVWLSPDVRNQYPWSRRRRGGRSS